MLMSSRERREMREHVAKVAAMEEQVASLERRNAELREELEKARDPQRIGGQADPGSFVYAIEQLREFRWQHATNDDDAIPYINNVAAAHERECAKLRELVKDMWPHVRHRSRMCGECDLPCDTSDECLLYEPMRQRMRELGVDDG